MSTLDPVRFFLGANTPTGFTGFHQTDLYDPRQGWVAFLIKSGAGTGKSTFMRKMQDTLRRLGHDCESVICSSDPSSLDAVVVPSLKLCIFDATAPHILEPTAYGECEQLVPFGCCLRPEITLAQTDAWFEAADSCAAAHARCCRFLYAAQSLLDTSRRLVASGFNADKAVAAAERLTRRECGPKRDGQGRAIHRFLSAVTPQGHLFLSDTAATLCPRLYILEDEYGVVSQTMMPKIASDAVAAGFDTILCPCPLHPQDGPEHVLIPSLGVGFLTSNRFHKIDMPVYRRIHASRFLDPAVIAAHKQQLRFNRRAAAALIGEAVEASVAAKEHHDRMEALHKQAMDWEEWERIAERTTATILRLRCQVDEADAL